MSEVSIDSAATTTTDDGEITENSAFDPKNIGAVTVIMLMRLYDLQLALLSSVNPEQAKYIVELHERGQSFAPPPSFVEYEGNEDD